MTLALLRLLPENKQIFLLLFYALFLWLSLRKYFYAFQKQIQRENEKAKWAKKARKRTNFGSTKKNKKKQMRWLRERTCNDKGEGVSADVSHTTWHKAVSIPCNQVILSKGYTRFEKRRELISDRTFLRYSILTQKSPMSQGIFLSCTPACCFLHFYTLYPCHCVGSHSAWMCVCVWVCEKFFSNFRACCSSKVSCMYSI